MSRASEPAGQSVSSEISSPGDLLVFVMLVVPIGAALALGVFSEARSAMLAWLIGHKVLVSSAVVEIPGTGVGLDLPRLLVFLGVVILTGVALARLAPRPGERPPR